MTDRDRLIQLLKEADDNASKKLITDYDDAIADNADYLLANGIIVPPCKAGDTVYMITPNGNMRNLTILGIDIELEKKEIKMTCLAVYKFEGNPCYIQIQSFKFGETVFLTREDAERALRECEGK